MRVSVSVVGSLVVAAVAVLTAQSAGGTRLDEFAGKLRLDPKTQAPAVTQIFVEAGSQAAPIAQEMLQLRQRLVNLELANRSAEVPEVLDAYTAAAARMTGLEVAVFQKVYSLLLPAQQSRAPEAFAFMAGFFQSAAARGGAGRGR